MVEFIKVNFIIIKHLKDIFTFAVNVMASRKSRYLRYTLQQYELDATHCGAWLSIRALLSIAWANFFPVFSRFYYTEHKRRSYYCSYINFFLFKTIKVYPNCVRWSTLYFNTHILKIILKDIFMHTTGKNIKNIN